MARKAGHPFHPIVYVRGFAGTQSEIEDTVADPYMGFNIGSTKARVAWNGDVRRSYFESPLVRLMSDHQYEDVYVDGDDLLWAERTDRRVPYRSIVIYRYYDEASKDFGDPDKPHPIEQFARGLDALILRLRDKVCANPDNEVSAEDFRVYLVAHSMGGLVCRAFLQNPALGSKAARDAVDKVFTYATPHNGIDLRVVRNVPGWVTFGDVDNFNRKRMAEYMKLPTAGDVSVVHGFPPERIFNLVGTNARDYTVASGFSSWAVGEASDGLVRIGNATTHGPGPGGIDVTSPRAFVHRSHSGYYGIVNSEEGYQNLTRFLFGGLRVDGILDIDDITFPEDVRKAFESGKEVHASYQFELTVAIRGCHWEMTRRAARENSAIFRKYSELFPRSGDAVRPPDRSKSPHLFSVFLDPSKSVRGRSVSFAFELKVLVPDYEVDGVLFLKRHYEGGSIYSREIVIEASPDERAPGGWRLKYGFQDKTPGLARHNAASDVIVRTDPDSAVITCEIPITKGRVDPAMQGRIRLEARPWNAAPR